VTLPGNVLAGGQEVKVVLEFTAAPGNSRSTR
jgi:hypothetical protein